MGQFTRIAVVGAGFTGTMFAVQLLRMIERPVEIILFDRRGTFGRGLAYSARNPQHLLNVRVSNMSAFDDDPQHFVRWLWQNDALYGAAPSIPPSGHAFVSRATYGAYIEDVFRSAVETAGSQRATITSSVDDVIDLGISGDRVTLALVSGKTIEFDRAILCFGNFPPNPPFPLDASLIDSGRFIADPWDEPAIDRIAPHDSVLIIGTGLTMVDVLVDLAARGHTGPIQALSRRGLLPQRHELTRSYTPFLDPRTPETSLVTLIRRVRQAVRTGAAQGYDWRSVMDTLRPMVQDLWLALPEIERQRFLRHLRPYWDIHRHRMAPANADQMAAWQATGRLATHAGRVRNANFADGKVRLGYRPRAGGADDTLTADWMINCAGPECDYRRIRHPLIQNLLAHGLARPDSLSLGLDLTERFELVGRDGIPEKRIFALGPPTRGMLWESTAVPDIRKQCARFARWLAEELGT